MLFMKPSFEYIIDLAQNSNNSTANALESPVFYEPTI